MSERPPYKEQVIEVTTSEILQFIKAMKTPQQLAEEKYPYPDWALDYINKGRDTMDIEVGQKEINRVDQLRAAFIEGLKDRETLEALSEHIWMKACVYCVENQSKAGWDRPIDFKGTMKEAKREFNDFYNTHFNGKDNI